VVRAFENQHWRVVGYLIYAVLDQRSIALLLEKNLTQRVPATETGESKISRHAEKYQGGKRILYVMF